MYRIQAHNIVLDRVTVYIVNSMEARDNMLKSLRNNPDYGLVTFEYNPRGSFYY